MSRPTKDQVFLGMAGLLALRATCVKLAVGCIITDSRGRIIGTGYNGVPSGVTHCTDVECPGAKLPKGSDRCQAIHAESNALLQCWEPHNIHVIYVTHAPCLGCVKVLMNTPCQRIVFKSDHNMELPARDMWTHDGRAWEHQP